jgi:hypothetical protein
MDDISINTCIHLMETKAETRQNLHQYESFVQNQYASIKRIRSHNEITHSFLCFFIQLKPLNINCHVLKRGTPNRMGWLKGSTKPATQIKCVLLIASPITEQSLKPRARKRFHLGDKNGSKG